MKNVTAKTFEALKTVFVELLYTEKLHGESFTPSERTQRQHEQNLHRKNDAENEFGEWTIDEENGEQGYIGDERSCFWTWDDKEKTLQSRLSKGRQVRSRRGKGFKGIGRLFIGEEHAHDPEWWSQEDGA